MRGGSEPREAVIEVDGVSIALAVRHHPRARRYGLRVDAAAGRVVLVVPPRGSQAGALRFARRHGAWARRRLAQVPPRTAFAPGTTLEVMGARVEIVHDPAHRGGAALEEDRMRVGGRPEFVARRVRDRLKAEARRELLARATACAATLGRRVRAVAVGDPRSRWGSCASDGALRFSWRLVLAPPEILDYVVAHEVAHLVEANHGARFWRLVDGLTPHRERAQLWLRRHGAALLRMG